jgi:putative hemolysin
MKIQAVFDHMNRKKVHLALVKDENGLVVGIITLEDIMEEIFGEIQDEHDDDEDFDEEEDFNIQLGIEVEATISLRDLYSDFDVKIPLNDNYSTLTGFVLDRLGNNFPKKGNLIFWDEFSFELTEVEDSHIIQVMIKNIGKEKVEEENSLLEEEADSVPNSEFIEEEEESAFGK